MKTIKPEQDSTPVDEKDEQMDEEVDDDVGKDGSEYESSESEEEQMWTLDEERGFLRALSAIKSGDPKIYDTSTHFYDKSKEIPSTSSAESSTSSSALANGGKQADKKPQVAEKMTLRDYELKLVTERGGCLSEDEDYDGPAVDESNYEKRERIRNEFKALFNSKEEEDDLEFLTKRVKTEAEKKQEENDYYEWLKDSANSNVFDEDLNKLKRRWSKRDALDSDELFLRDYLLEKQYVNDGEEELANENGTLPTYEEIIEQDAEEERAEQFEHKYNFRFEEPDQEFIKQYPRTVNGTLRTTKKKRKRAQNSKAGDREMLKKIMSELLSDEDDEENGGSGFKYRNVPCNDFGLSTAEILMADDKQLNAWASVSRVIAYRSNEEEQHDIERFQRKAKNISLKERIFKEPSPSPADDMAKTSEFTDKKKKRRNRPAAAATKTSAKKAAGDVQLLNAERLRAYGVRTKRLKKQLNRKKMEARRQKKLEEAETQNDGR